jgi:multidrug efflux system membrane fusion protein
MKKYISLLLLAFACSKPAPPPAPVSVATATASICDVPLFYDYVGHVTAYNIVKIVPQVQGYLTDIYFQQGQEVKEGDLLATIDVRPYEASLAQAQAQLAQTIAELRYSEDAVERYAKLVQNDFVSQLDFDNYVTNVLSNEAIVKQNLAQIETAKLNLSYCYMKAPMDSIAGQFLVNVGNFIPAGNSNPIVTLNQIKPIYVQFTIPEDDLPRIQKLQNKKQLPIRAFVEGEQGKSHNGVLTFINNQVNESTGSIDLEATFQNDDKTLWPGQFASVRVFLGTIKDAVVIPSQAVQIGQKGPYVYVIKENTTPEMRPIKTGEKIGEYVVVTSGLCADEIVVTQGQVNIIPGVSKVSIENQNATKPTFDSGFYPP